MSYEPTASDPDAMDVRCASGSDGTEYLVIDQAVIQFNIRDEDSLLAATETLARIAREAQQLNSELLRKYHKRYE